MKKRIELLAKIVGQPTPILKVIVDEETFNAILQIIKLRRIKE